MSPSRVALLTTAVLGILSNLSYAQSVRQDFPCVDGTVEAIVIDGNTLYLGGLFRYIGPITGPLLVADAATGQVSTIPRVTGSEIDVVVSDGTGGWYIGGQFTEVNGVPRSNIAHILADHSVDTWDPGITGGAVRAILVQGSTVYVGGSFRSAGGQPRDYLAALDASTGAVTAWNPGAAGGFGGVLALATNGTTIYVAGSFSSLGGQPRSGLGSVDAVTGAVTTWNPSPTGGSPVTQVRGLAVNGSTIYAVGNFTSIGFKTRRAVAALDATTGGATNWDVGMPNGDVYCVAIDGSGSTVYLGGSFNAQGRLRLGAFDATTGLATAWNPSPNAEVLSMSLSGSSLYVGGYFTAIGGQPRNYLAELSTSTGNATAWDSGTSNAVFAIARLGNEVCAGGYFKMAGGKVRRALAAIDIPTGAVKDWNPAPSGTVNQVHALALSGSTLYVGGSFDIIGGQNRANIAALDVTTATATTWNPGTENRVRAFALQPGFVFAAGNFFTLGGQPRNRVGKIDAVTGLVTGWNANVIGGSVLPALAFNGSYLYAGGPFTNIGGQPRQHIAALDPTTAAATSWNPDAGTGTVNAIQIDGSNAYVAGGFSFIGGQPRRNLAAVDLVTGNATPWDPDAGSTGAPLCLAVNGPVVYVGGTFSTIGSQPRDGLAAVQTATGYVLPWNVGLTGFERAVNTIKVQGSTVYIGGAFETVAGAPRSGIAAISEAVTGVSDPVPQSPELALAAHPNPFRRSTTIQFHLDRAAEVSLSVHDVNGRVVARLVQGERLSAGPHDVAFDGRGLFSGVYLCRLDVGGIKSSRRIVLIP
ncbi:MAG TPA: T9SS type A sorting domain-containing protein [Candidatus Eisenbacteria bacterium]|nr:T9SS type A sorting domain-containing protein [Candidatus Eisenbacteria bacterium]